MIYFPFPNNKNIVLLQEKLHSLPHSNRQEQVWQRKKQTRQLLQSLPELSQARIGHYSSGAPFLINHHSLNLSISHSKQELVLLLSPREEIPGIDVEEINNRPEKIRHKFMTTRELGIYDQLSLQDSQDAILWCCMVWCSKEAAYKVFNPSDHSLKKNFELSLPSYTQKSLKENLTTEFSLKLLSQQHPPLSPNLHCPKGKEVSVHFILSPSTEESLIALILLHDEL
jgi:4'-phosphopantetheinyl transferase EntD